MYGDAKIVYAIIFLIVSKKYLTKVWVPKLPTSAIVVLFRASKKIII